MDSAPAQHCDGDLSDGGELPVFYLVSPVVCATCTKRFVAQAVPLKTFVSDAKDVKIDDLCPLNMMWLNDLMSQRPSRKGIQASDMSPARDMSATDREATRRIVQARGVDPASTTASDMNLKFYVMIAVRSYRRCQETAYRHFVLRMRMKAMYAFIASSKSSGLSAAPTRTFAIHVAVSFVIVVIMLYRPELPCR